MLPLESSVSDATIWSIALESSSMTLEALFTLIYDVYSTGISYNDCQLMSEICLQYSPWSELNKLVISFSYDLDP